MPYPPPPEIATSYTAVEQALGDGTLPGQELDVDLASIRASVTAVIEFVKLITRSDGKLANGIVTQEALGAALIIGFDPPSVWATATDYTTRSIVFEGTKIYLCLVEHTSSVFATDLSSGRWSLLADLTPTGGALIASNNLSDLTDVGNARAALGLGSMATAASGTGAAQHRTNIQNEAFFQPLASGLTSWAAITRASGFDTFAVTPSSANLRALLTDETGTGALLFAGGAMGTPSSLTLTNASGLTTAGIAAAALTTASETIAANNVDTQVPTSAAVKAYADTRGRVLLASKTASASATLDFTEFDNATYRYYEFVFENVKPTTDNTFLNARFSTDGGSSYDSGASDYQWTSEGRQVGGSVANSSAAAAECQITSTGGMGNAAAEFGLSGKITLYHAGDGAVRTRYIGDISYDSATTQLVTAQVGGLRNTAQDTTAIRFLMNSGTIASGVIRMYGVRE